jgi:hypothetical protein
MATSIHFELNTGAQIPAVGLGTIQALVSAGLSGFADKKYRHLAIRTWSGTPSSVVRPQERI